MFIILFYNHLKHLTAQLESKKKTAQSLDTITQNRPSTFFPSFTSQHQNVSERRRTRNKPNEKDHSRRRYQVSHQISRHRARIIKYLQALKGKFQQQVQQLQKLKQFIFLFERRHLQ